MRKSAFISLVAALAIVAVSSPSSPSLADEGDGAWPSGCRPQLRVTVESPTSVKVWAKPGPNWWKPKSAEGDGAIEGSDVSPLDMVEEDEAEPTPTPTPTPTPSAEPTATPSPEPTSGTVTEPEPTEPSPVAQSTTPSAATTPVATRAKSFLPTKKGKGWWQCPNPHILIKGVNETTASTFEAFPAKEWETRIAMLPNQTLRVSVKQGNDSVEQTVTTPSGVPGPPEHLVVTKAGPTFLALQWGKPKNDSELPIKYYEVFIGDTKYVEVKATEVLIAPLESDTTYTVKVIARNAYGPSSAAVATGRTLPKVMPPDRPGNLRATAVTQSTVALKWTRPSDGGSPVIGYKLFANDEYKDYTTAESATVKNLKANTKYSIEVRAVNDVGDSIPAATSAKTTEVTLPGAPESLAATETAADHIALAWKPPLNDGGSPVTSYDVSWGKGTSASATGTSIVLNGLKPAHKYSITVAARNEKGAGDQAKIDARTILNPVPRPTVPLAPRELAAPGVTQTTVTLDWLPPASTGGAEVTSYTVTWGTGTGKSVDPASTSAEITGLTAATQYTFKVTADNVMGSSDPPAEISVWTHYPPVPRPTAPTTVLEAGAIAVSQTAIEMGWLPPASDGGSPVQFYLVGWDGGQGAVVTETSVTAQGLLPATEYTFTIQAKNQMGLSDPVSVKATTHYPPVPEPTAPTAPRSLISTGVTPTSVGLAWLRPESDGGNPITDYTVTWGAGKSLKGDSTSTSVTGLAASTDYTFSVRANNAMGSSAAVSLTVQTPAPPSPPTPTPGPAPKPADITPAAHGANADGSLDADADRSTLRQTVDAKWPANVILISGKALTVQKKTGLITNAAQEVTFEVAYMSPSVRSVVVQKRPNKGAYLLTATLKKGKKSGCVILTASAPATLYKGRMYEPLQSSQRFIVKPATKKR